MNLVWTPVMGNIYLPVSFIVLLSRKAHEFRVS